MRSTSLLLAFLTVSSQAAERLPADAFNYDQTRPIDIQVKSTEKRGGVDVADITFADTEGGRTGAYLVKAAQGRKGPGILFVHWYEPPKPTSNRTQFLNQALELAYSGVTSLLIDTMWSDPKWFESRKPAEDYSTSIRQVKELRRALDVLLAQKGVDPKKIVYVGHDFGAMYGAVLAGIDHRPSLWALQAGTTSFSTWFLLGRELPEAEKKAVVDGLAPLDPTLYVGDGHPILFQFAKRDKFVTEEQANKFFAAAGDPKEIMWYDAEHEMNDQSIQDRQAWLKKKLGIK